MAIPYLWVDSDEKLHEVCEAARQKKAVALDTEFIRIRTFYPQLGLIQLFDGQTVSLIDPKKIQDFSAFCHLLADEQVTKVLHACSEDLEVFQHRFQQLPTPMIDTDWLARPLSEVQLDYAAADVWYLLPIYQKMQEAMQENCWMPAVREECEQLLQKRQKIVNPNKAYLDISQAWQLTPQQLAVLQVLAKWRLEEAQKRDLALNFVVKEQSLFEIAKTQPKHTSELLNFMHPNEVRIHGKKLLWLVEQGQAVPQENYPEKINRLFDEVGYKQDLKAMQQKLAEIRPLDLPAELLASKRQLNQLFKWHRQGRPQTHLPELMQGWRANFGQLIVEVLA